MEKISRRTFMKLGGISSAFLFTRNINIDKLTNPEDKFMDFREIGPNFSERGDGVRSIFVNPQNSNEIVVGSFMSGSFYSYDGGNNWQNFILPNNENIDANLNTIRDIILLDSNHILMVADYSIMTMSIGHDPGRTSNGNIESEKLSGGPQTACLIGDEVVIAGYSGFYKTKTKKLLESQNFGSYYDWGESKKIGDLPFSMIRSLKYDNLNNILYAGGWMSPKDEYTGQLWPGTGLYQSFDRGETFQKHSFYDLMIDPKGPVSINSIESIRFKGHDIVIIGGEGVSPEIQASPDVWPVVYILVDGAMYDKQLTNNYGLVNQAGVGLITPQRGIIASQLTEKLYISSYSGNIVTVNLDSIINREFLDWTNITPNRNGENLFSSGHMRLTHSDREYLQLTVGGQSWSGARMPVPVRTADIHFETKKIPRNTHKR